MAFRVGQKVVCIDAGPAIDGHRLSLMSGSVYTILAVRGKPDSLGDEGVRVVEVDTPPPGTRYREFTFDEYFRATRFRPVVERKTDISIFEKMLTSKKEHARA